MKRFLLAPVILSLLVSPAVHAVEDEKPGEKRPGMVTRFLNIFRGSKGEKDGKNMTAKRMEVSMVTEPEPLRLSESRLLKVTLQVANRSKRFVQFDFPTTQRIEVLIKTPDGKLVEQWSEDQSFSNDPTIVTVNPGERLEYVASVATRDLKAGQTYVIEGFFPNHETLRVQKTIVPAP